MSLVKTVSEITKATNIYSTFGDKIGKSTVKIKDFGDKAIKTTTTIEKTATGTLKQVNTSTWKAFGKSMDSTGKAAKESKKGGGAGSGGFGDIVGLFLEPILRPLIKIFKPFGIIFDIFAAGLQQELLPIMKRIFALLTDPLIIQAIMEIGRLVGTLFLPMLGAIEQFLTAIIANPQVLEDFMNMLRIVLGFFADLAGILTTALIDVLKGVFQFFLDNPKIIQDLLTGLQEFVNFMLSVPEALGSFGFKVGAGADVIGQFFGRLGHDIGAFFTGQPLAGFATGGIVRRPTFAMIGEKGPEAVIPLNEFAQRAEEFGVGGGGKSITIVVNGVTDIPRLARKIRDEVEFL